MDQISFAEAEYTQKRRSTHREKFLSQNGSTLGQAILPAAYDAAHSLHTIIL